MTQVNERGGTASRVAIVTGASRGIGAVVARMLAARGVDVAINYRSKRPRAEAVADEVRAAGRRACLVEADLVDRTQVERMVAATVAELGPIDVLVMNASGGLEKDKDASYALRLNLDAQLGLLDAALPHMRSGGRIAFVTSHPAHFYGEKPVMPAYEVVASSKHAGEQALRARIPELAARGVSLVVVSGDMIEGTITPRLLERAERGAMDARRAQVGPLPTVDEFAAAIVGAALDATLESGSTIFVGSTD